MTQIHAFLPRVYCERLGCPITTAAFLCVNAIALSAKKSWWILYVDIRTEIVHIVILSISILQIKSLMLDECGCVFSILQLRKWLLIAFIFASQKVKTANGGVYVLNPLFCLSFGTSVYLSVCPMMTSSNGNIFRFTGPLCGEFTGHRGIPLTKAGEAELWFFL